jgi:hypothetical protein
MNNLSGIPNPSTLFRKHGYVIDEMGPIRFEGKGKEKVSTEAADLIQKGKALKGKPLGRCPMAF